LVPRVFETPDALREWVGREIGVTDWFTITQEHILRFADVSGDWQWIHLDPERALRESPFRTTIAHGFLTLSLLSRFVRQVYEIRGGVSMTLNYGLNRVRFPAPVRAGSKIRGHVVLQSVNDVSGALEAVLEVTIEAENSRKPCCVAEWVLHYYS